MQRSLCLASLVLFACLILPQPSVMASPPCVRPPENVVYATFIQPLEKVSRWDESTWDALFARFEALHLREIVVQWTAFDDMDFTATATRILHMAEARGMKVWIGLRHDSSWWKGIAGPQPALEAYLWKTFRQQTAAANRLVPLVALSPAFSGFYLPMELDDTTWSAPERRACLLRVLTHFKETCVALMPTIPFAISGFANGHESPDGWAYFWLQIIQASGVQRVYVQDGVGAHKLLPDEAALYLAATRNAMNRAGVETAAVIEAFNELPPTPTSPFRAEPASLPSLLEQACLAASTGVRTLAIFSVPDYMTRFGSPAGETLGREWQRLLN